MTETDITLLMSMNREAMTGWVLSAVVLTLAIFGLAYLIRNTPLWLRAVLFVSFALTSINLYMTMAATNAAFLGLVQELARLSQLTEFSSTTANLLGATPTQAPTLPILVRITLPLVTLLNLVIGCYLFLLAKWER